MSRSTKITSLLVLLVVLCVSLRPAVKVNALSGNDFNAGRIIDDSIFYTGGDLSAAQIQSFLETKVPVCDTSGIQPYAGTTRAAYGASRSNPAPFTCLRDYTNTYDARIANEFCQAIPAGLKSASQIIYEVSVSCGVSARALIVLLEKEQGLVTDDWPWTVQYRSATGYGCPDTAPCDTQYYGFYNQVYNAARQFRNYAANPQYFRYKPFQNNTILYNPNTACGSSTVYVESKATAALYNYTPYQPNAAALANLNGIGDSCSAYGNRNFWRLFNNWFGTTLSGTDGLQAFTIAHPTGSIVRGLTGGSVYKIIDGYRVKIPSYTAFQSWGYDDSSIKIMNRGDEALPIHEQVLGYRSGIVVREAGDVKINTIECTTQFFSSCQKRHIASYPVFLGLGYDVSKDVLQYPSGELQSMTIGTPIITDTQHPEGTLVQDRTSNKVYVIKAQKLYHIPSFEVFTINRFNIKNIRPMTNFEFGSMLRTADPFVYDSNILVRTTNAPAIYSIGENGWGTVYKRHIETYSTFLQLGYKDNEVTVMDADVLTSILTIDPIH